jgi:hypothetical protein
MEPLAVITTALVAGAAAALKNTAAQVVKDAYDGIKRAIASRTGKDSQVTAALTTVEGRPDNELRRKVLEEELKSAGVDQDAEVLKLAEALGAALKQHEPQLAERYNVTVSGGGAAAVGPGARAVGQGGVMVDGNVHGSINTGTINTGGGAYVGGNVSAAGNVAGRDQTINNFYGQPPADPAGAAGSGLIASEEGRKLYKLLNDYFSMDDIEGLCFELGIDEDNLRGETKLGKARALVQHVEANGRRDELKKLMRVQRPNLRSQLQ